MQLNNCKIFTYGDETALLAYRKSWIEAKAEAENSLRKVILWLSSNLLTLNVEKSKYIRFYLPNSPKPSVETLTLTAHCCNYSTPACSFPSLLNVVSIKYLDVIIDERLGRQRPQVDSLTGRVRRFFYVF